ncbi:hypothetical protein GC096_35765 [Paenibacillus sp. LMG 31461]|uniref:Uncharacterized protein n=1 Tax=Paenibacillus plantarum TaxID=2654975 RepID=A0ABX1XLH5_9BACL|nr:S-layer homology domain-containing protein [Paenibacillus plantarum]NOU69378.1 hypothetical protein [Paenibacillus plantarum]
MLKTKKFVSAFMACTIACSVVYSAGAGFVPVAFATASIDTPTASLPAGRYEESVSVTLNSAISGANIYYTLDGTKPDETSLTYDGLPIVLTDSTNLSVIALKDGIWSKPATYGYIIKTSEKPLLKFAAMSDIHIGPGTDEENAKVRARYASNFDVMSSIFPNPDAILIAGDLINDNGDGKGPHHTFVRDVFQEQMARKGWTNMPVQIAIGNHDASVAEVKNYYPADWFTTQSNGYYEKTIGDYSFFFLNGNNYNSDTTQRNWLKGRLAALTADPANINKPIFITLHHPISSTIMDGQQGSNTNLNTDLLNYPQVIVMSGHSHLDINDDRSIYQKDYTSVNLGSMSYIETDHGYSAVTDEGLIEGRFEFPNSQSQFIEVYKDRVEIERVEYNGDPGSIYVGGVWQGAGGPVPYKSAGALAGKKWVIQLKGNTNAEIKSNFTYTTSNRNKTAPQFPTNPDVTVVVGTNNVPVLSFRQAKDDQSMHHYEIKALNMRTGAAVKSYNVLSDFYFSPIPNKMNVPMPGLAPATSYVLTITGVDAYGNKSSPLQTLFRTDGTAPELTPIDPATMWNQLVSDMKFDNNLNDDALGVTGMSTKAGSVTYVDGKSGKAASIAAGNANYIDLGNRSDLKFGNGNFTVSFWHTGNLAADQTVIANKNWNSGLNLGWYIGPATSNNMTLNMADGTKRVDYSAASVGTEWHLFTLTVDRANKIASTYVDGVFKKSGDLTLLGTSSLDTAFNIIIGADGNKGNGGATVTIDDLKIWKRALNATEAKALSDSYLTTTLYTYDQLITKIQETQQFATYAATTTGITLPAQTKTELEAQLAAAMVLTASSDAALIDQAYLDLMWTLQVAKDSVMYTFIPKTAFTINAFSSYADNENAYASNILDGQETTIWHSKYQAPAAPFPHTVIIDMDSTYKLNGIQRKSRLSQTALEFPKTFELYASDNLADLNDPAYLGVPANKASGTFGKTWTGTLYKDYVSLDKPVQGRYVKFVVTETYNSSSTFTSMSEIDFTGDKISSGNAKLTDLKVNGITVSHFAPDQTNYSMSVPNNVSVATVTYATYEPQAMVVVTGGSSLQIGDNVVTINVTTPNGHTHAYVIQIHRADVPLPSDASLLDLRVNGSTVSGFASDKLDYSFSVPYDTTVTTVTYTAADPAATVLAEGAGNWVVGENQQTVTVTVTAQNSSQQVYTIVITRQPEVLSSNANLIDLRVNGATVSGFASDQLDYKVYVSNSTTVATVTYSTEHPLAKVMISGGNPLSVGDNPLSVLVTAQDGTSKTYRITVNRASDEPGSETTTPPVEPPVNPVKPELPKDAVTIKEEDLKSSSSSVSVELTQGITSVVIPIEQVQQLNGRPLTVHAENVSLVVPSDLLKSLNSLLPSNDDSAVITVKLEPISTTQAEQTLQQANRNVNSIYSLGGQIFDLSITVTDEAGKPYKVSELPKSVTVTFPIPAGMDPKLAGIYRILEDGSFSFIGGKLVSGNSAIEVGLDHLSQYAVISLEKTYDDVTKQHWAYSTIRELSAQHIVNGATDSSFEPTSNVTRAEFAALLVRVLGLTSSGTASFSDVAGNAWYLKDVSAAYQAGIITGNSQQMFEPTRSITREEMAIMLVRAYEHRTGQKTDQGSAQTLDASKISDWALPYVNKALNAKLLTGRQEGLFVPSEHTTRAEAAQAVYNLLN